MIRHTNQLKRYVKDSSSGRSANQVDINIDEGFYFEVCWHILNWLETANYLILQLFYANMLITYLDYKTII